MGKQSIEAADNWQHAAGYVKVDDDRERLVLAIVRLLQMYRIKHDDADRVLVEAVFRTFELPKRTTSYQKIYMAAQESPRWRQG